MIEVQFTRDFEWTPFEGSDTYVCQAGDRYEVDDDCAALAIESDCAFEVLSADEEDGETDGE